MKSCSKCKEYKPLCDFHKRNNSKDGRRSHCKVCILEYRKYQYSKPEVKANRNEYYNRPEVKARKKITSQRRDSLLKSKERRNEIHKERSLTDINYRLKKNLRSRLYQALKSSYKTGSAVSDLGCSIEELKKHLETQFTDDMSWDNWTTNGWHIDHKKALANFDLTNKDELLKACHYTNLKPMWAKENLSKGAKYA